MDKQKHEDIIEYLLHPRKLQISTLFSDISCGEFMLIAAFLGYEDNHPGKHITVNELASLLDVSIPAVSRMLKNLEARGLIVRETDKDCRRNTLVVITELGMTLFSENQSKIRCLTSRILEQFTEEEIDMMLKLSKKAEQTLEKEIEFIAGKEKAI